MIKNNEMSRRNFIKSGSILSVSSLFAIDFNLTFLAQASGVSVKTIINRSFSCELFRSSDLLQLRFFIFNSDTNAYPFIRRVGSTPLFMYCQIPPQHIAEELVLEKFASRATAKTKKSFLSGHSWLAFKLLDSNTSGFNLNEENLLDWEKNFELITLDSFANKRNDTYTGYDKSLPDLKAQFNNIGKINEETEVQNRDKDNKGWPLTILEVPYKLFLSPIAQPLAGTANRIFGEHLFSGDNSSVNLLPDLFKEKNKFTQINKSWTNELIFKTFDNQVLNPRFKAVHYLCQDTFDNGVELLPAPIHRDEIHGLTMMPAADRDIFTNLFQLSATGSTANLFYKNDDPTKDYSTIAWEQKIAEARDNYVSITFRAIDVFTGIKLKVSIVAERAYSNGISYLPKLYYVAYAEKEKKYTQSIVISKIPFVKLIPRTTGAYFYPRKIGSGFLGYQVARPDSKPDSGINCNEAIPFDYTGIDKDGKEHNFQSKIIFIPAENYEILSGDYNYRIDNKIIDTYNTSKPTVPIEHIGQLNPSKQEKYKGLYQEKCPPIPGGDNYMYRMNKIFDDKVRLDALLSEIKAHVTANTACYEQNVLGEVTYARITQLKEKKSVKINNQNVEIREIRPDSTAASFETDRLQLFSISGNILPAADNYLQEFPLIPTLVYSNVVISQINQIEGRNVYRKVEFAEAYFKHEAEIDEDNPSNRVKLLFKLVDVPQNFFSANYKSAGAVVNPGIEITHVSVLDQGITYNESHNQTDAVKFKGGVAEQFTSASIFKNLDAKILGIPLLEILQEVLPVEDLPAFSYLKEAQETIKKLDNLIEEYKTEFSQYKNLYDTDIVQIEKYKNDLQQFDKLVRGLNKDMARSWLEVVIQESGAYELYENQKNALTQFATEYQAYYKSVLEPVKQAIDNKFNAINIKVLTDTLFKAQVTYASIKTIYIQIDQLNSLSKEVKLQYLKETVKIYAIEKIMAMPPNSPFNIKEAILNFNKLSKEVEDNLLNYQNAVVDGLQQASSFAQGYVTALADDLKIQLDARINNISAEIFDLLKKLGLQNIYQFIAPFDQLLKAYADFKKLYDDLKTDYYTLLYKSGLMSGEIPLLPIEAIEQKLMQQFKDYVNGINIPASAPSDLVKAFGRLKAEYDKNFIAPGNKFKNLLSNIESAKTLQLKIQAEAKFYLDIINSVDKGYTDLINSVNNTKKLLKEVENKVKNFLQLIIEEYTEKLNHQKEEIIKFLRGSKEYTAAASIIAEIQGILKKLNEFAKQSLDYSYQTKNFKNANLGVIEFLPNTDTELSVKVKYEIEFEISPTNSIPAIKKQSYITDSSLSDFRLGLMQFLYIDFERVKFVTGSDVKDEFSVNIRDVQFAGMLSFVQAFQQYLQSIDRNLVFDIDSSGVRVGYGFAIPDFPAGYFNFFNLSFSGLLTLPFDPKKSLQLKFGIGSELNKFGITVGGIFGGQGYFNILAEVGRGIVGMELVLEFGAIFNLSLTVASGTAYLVGGIYIRQYNGNFNLRGYILCLGRLDILGLFTASLSFYLGLEYDGHVLKGACQVTASKRFSRFFEISIKVRMEKTISGTESSSKNNDTERLQGQMLDKNVVVEDTNMADKFYRHDRPYMILSLPEGYENLTTELVRTDGFKSNKRAIVAANYSTGSSGQLIHINLSHEDIKTEGAYQLNVKNNGVAIYEGNFNIVKPETLKEKFLKKDISTVNAAEYYGSYF